MTREPRQHDLLLDILRAVAAGLVMLYHLIPAASLSARGGTAGGKPLWFSWIGVQLFFVISGYVIAQSAARGTARAFLIRRMARLAPTAWICASITALALLATATLPATTILWRWLLAALFVPTPLAIDGVCWTLSVELVFYLLVAACLGAFGQRDHLIERLGFLLGSLSTAFWVGAHLILDHPSALLASLPLRLTLLPHGALFALGVILCQLRAAGPTRGRQIAALMFLGGALLQIDAASVRIGAEWGVTGPVIAPYLLFLAGVVAIHAAARLEPCLKRLLPPGAVTTIGLMTYPLYLLHHSVGLIVALALIAAGLSGPPAVAVAIGCMIGLAWLVTTRLEPPVRRALVQGWLSDRSEPRRQTRPSRAFWRA